MKFLVQVICVSEHAERCEQVFEMEREHLTMETLGLGLRESKALLRGVQEFVVAEQVAADLERRRCCPDCGKRHASKAQGCIKVKTVFGPVEIPNPRWHRCSCQSTGPSTFRPMTSWLGGQTSPELLYLETKWASLIPYAKVAELLKDVLPVADTLNHETVRNHLHTIANRIEQELGEEPVRLFEGSDQDWEEKPLPDGPMTVGIDGGFVRAAHKEGWFEVIAGKSVVAFRREEAGETPSSKCFGFVQTYDEKPRRRLWELLKSQGMQENQQVVFLSDGGDTVRQLQEYLHPCSEHLIDWFHVTMRLTVLQQQAKGLQTQRPLTFATTLSMKPYETTLHDLNIYLAASPPDPGHAIRETESWLKLNEPIGLARAIFSRGGRLVLFGSPEVSRIAAFVAGDYFHPGPRRQHPPLVLCDGTAEEQGSPYSDFGYQAVMERGVVFKEFSPSALVVVCGDFRVAEFAQEFAKHFKESPIYVFPSTGGAAVMLIERARELHAINLEQKRPMAERHVARFLAPPYALWMQMIRDRIEASWRER
jgi:hypothetical protein